MGQFSAQTNTRPASLMYGCVGPLRASDHWDRHSATLIPRCPFWRMCGRFKIRFGVRFAMRIGVRFEMRISVRCERNTQHLQHKLEDDPAQPRYMITESGVGYRLQLP